MASKSEHEPQFSQEEVKPVISTSNNKHPNWLLRTMFIAGFLATSCSDIVEKPQATNTHFPTDTTIPEGKDIAVLPTLTPLSKLQSTDLPPTNTPQPTITNTSSPPPPTASSTPTATEVPSPTPSSTPTLEPTPTQSPATATMQPPTLESTQPPPTIELTSPPPIETPTNGSPRKTGDIWLDAGNRWIDLCPESTPKLQPHYVNNRPIDTFNLHTYVVAVNGNQLTVYNDSSIGGTTTLPINEYRIIRQGSYNKETVTSSEYEPLDCVFVSKVIVDSQPMPGPFVVFRASDN